MKRWINSNGKYEEYDTEEYIIFKERVRERIRDKVKYINIKANLFNKEKIVLKIFSSDEKVNELNIEYDIDDFVGFSFLLNGGLPSFEGFFEKNQDIYNKNSLRSLLVNSKLDGWNIKDRKNIRHSVFMFNGRQDILTNENDNFNIVKQDINEEIIAVPLKNKINPNIAITTTSAMIPKIIILVFLRTSFLCFSLFLTLEPTSSTWISSCDILVPQISQYLAPFVSKL